MPAMNDKLVSNTSPSGTIATAAATVPSRRVLPRVLGVEQIDEQEDGGDRNDHGEPTQDRVDALAELRLGGRELFGLGGEHAGVAVGAHRGRPDPSVAGDDEAAREHIVADLLGDRKGLTGEHRLVEPKPGRLEHDAIDGHLPAEAEFDHIVHHDLVGGNLHGAAVADHRRPGFGDDGESLATPAEHGPLGRHR